jgi:fructoselysine-6-P-deglycase FrlB-like protein
VKSLAQWAAGVLETRVPLIAGLAQAGYERVVYLGGQEFKGLAREAALKMLELSDGNMVALAETPLGFRHGPKTIVNGKTLVVMFLSNDPYARQYEADLLRELRSDGVAGRVVALGAAEESISVGAPATASNLALLFPYAVFAQTRTHAAWSIESCKACRSIPGIRPVENLSRHRRGRDEDGLPVDRRERPSARLP